jgi:hypothetical protein
METAIETLPDDPVLLRAMVLVQIPTQSGHLFRFHSGH